MRYLVFAMAAAMATPSMADEIAIAGPHKGSRAFWLDQQPWPTPQQNQPTRTVKPKFPMTYMDSVAARFGAGTGDMGLFSRRIGRSGPSLIGTIDDGAPKLVLRWRFGQ
ncbi:MAG TPA: hypothetical protein VHC42_06575 [Rhizomicrobium sp.]|nr:hypothetical protein [Rhizomicrobium sp.]